MEEKLRTPLLRWTLGTLCPPMGLIFLFFLLRRNRAAMNFWVFRVAAPVEQSLGRFWGWFPFSVAEVLTGLALAGLLLGPKLGTISATAYVVLGLVGLPIFTEGGGFWYVLKPSFGYLLGFCVGTFVTGWLSERWNGGFGRDLAANLAGLAVVYAMGMGYYSWICNHVLGSPIGLWPLILYCFLLAVPGDLVLSLLAAGLARRLRPIVAGQAAKN